MAKIHILSPILAHQIAAGEIVERPASVVKELLENALDAQAKRIIVKVEGGGKQSISVHDNGFGMSAEDARLAFEHHATSKIHSFEDLRSVRTLGFRGEALPSIASVSRLRLRTIEKNTANGDSPLGAEVRMEGGKLKTVEPINWPLGTKVEVEDLFFNVPARRKFLKREPTELHHLSRQVTHYALAHPKVEFQLTHGKRNMIQATAVSDLRSRIYQLMGETLLEKLVPVQHERDGILVSGWTSLPHEQRRSNNTQFIYVNGRLVRNAVLAHAVRLAYRDRIFGKFYPAVILMLDIDPKRIDVNVHPCKTEIRFHDSSSVHRAIYHGIEEALLAQKSQTFQLAPRITGQIFEPNAHSQNFQLSTKNSQKNKNDLKISSDFSINSTGNVLPLDAHNHFKIQTKHAMDNTREIPETDYISPIPIVLGQFVESFVVAADRNGVILVDQHVAHERILYDQALNNLGTSNGCSIQRLLIPLMLDLHPQQLFFLKEILLAFNNNGFEVESFGGRSIVIKGIPSFAQECDGRLLIEESLKGLELHGLRTLNRDNAFSHRLREKIAISSSCQAAIKINTRLPKEKMQWLLDKLFHCKNPFTCPHGRPIVLRIGIEEVLHSFKRI